MGGENSISHEVVDSGEFVLNLIGRVCIYLSVLALPVGLVSGQTRTRLGEFSPAAPDRGAPPAGAQAQTAGQGPVVLGGALLVLCARAFLPGHHNVPKVDWMNLDRIERVTEA